MKLTIKAYAKINLGLDVLRRREDGYHDVKMIMQTVDLYDIVTLEKMPKYSISGGQITVLSNHADVPDDDSNIAYKAAKLLIDEFGIEDGIRINITKNIPVAAGMAGGSTDAAAVLKGMNELFSLGKSDEELMRFGVKIGADVPYCIFGGTALSEGIGDMLTRVNGNIKCKVLIAKPPINVSTKYVYENLHVDTIKVHPDIDGLKAAIEHGDITGMSNKLENILENVTTKKYPVIDTLKQFMKDNGALNSIMSGSGPTVFGIYDNEEAVNAAFYKLKQLNITDEIYVTDLSDAGISIGGLQ